MVAASMRSERSVIACESDRPRARILDLGEQARIEPGAPRLDGAAGEVDGRGLGTHAEAEGKGKVVQQALLDSEQRTEERRLAPAGSRSHHGERL